MEKYIMKLKPALRDILWGGTKLADEYGKGKPGQRIAETWELSCHPDGVGVIGSGLYAGMKLTEYLGTEDFPTLIKLIDARDDLSVQVHPAKTEMWVIVDCDEGAQLVYGLKDKFDEGVFRRALEEGRIGSLLNTVPVHKGDVFFIPSGLVHAIGKGILIAEIQQSSNVTYRVYDYGRLQNGKPRQLHVEEAIRTIRDFTEDELTALRYAASPKAPEARLASTAYFTTDSLTVSEGNDARLDAAESWICLICIGGSVSVGDLALAKGETAFVPAGFGQFTVSGAGELLVTQIL